MKATLQSTMRAAAIDQFGGIEKIKVRTLPVPDVGADEVLIHVESAGVGVWDPFEREGGFAKEFGIAATFPLVIGTEGAGEVVAVGQRVRRFKEGDRVYAMALSNPKGGFYAQFAAVKADNVAIIPDKISTEQAGVMAADGITAMQGLHDALGLKKGQSVMIFGASGGVGHLGVQLAKRMGANVLAVASGSDGVALVKRLGADLAVNGKTDDVSAAARKFAPDGLDAALLCAGGDAADRALDALRDGGRVAYPNGVEPEPKAQRDLVIKSYNGDVSRQALDKLNQLIESGPFEVHVAKIFPLDRVAEAHRALETHFLGKLAIRP